MFIFTNVFKKQLCHLCLYTNTFNDSNKQRVGNNYHSSVSKPEAKKHNNHDHSFSPKT